MPTTCSQIFSSFSCLSFDNDGIEVSYLQRDLSIVCREGGVMSEQYRFIFAYAWLMTFM